jgi:hypothetical protein
MEMANHQERLVVGGSGRTTGVLLPLRRYRKLMEDIHDLAIVAERRKEKPITLEQMKHRLR